MNNDYRKREGGKDLMDIFQPKKGKRGGFFSATIRLPGLQRPDIKIFLEGNTLRIVVKQAASDIQYERKIRVPIGFVIAKARAIYLMDRLCITAPKARAQV